MDTVREQIKNPLVAGIAAFILGLLLGWFALGWGLFPVQWTDAAPDKLRADLKQDYLRMAIDSYTVNKDAALATQRYTALGDDAAKTLELVQANPGGEAPDAVAAFRIAVGAGTAGLPAPTAVSGTPAAETPAAETPAAAGAAKPAGSNLIKTLLPVLCVITLLLAGGLIALFVLRGRGGGGLRTSTPAMQAQQAARQAEWTDYQSIGEESPMVQFMASYKLGDDLFDDSFSIDSPSGEFLGECGVGISETIGVGDPKKVTAFEVWLFDKNDIQTVTKVLMSGHAFMDEPTRQRLVAKGEPVLVEPGKEVVLETQSLRLVVRVVDTGYGEGALPEQSFFDRLILELAIWQKA